jgi:hypothetical protein
MAVIIVDDRTQHNKKQPSSEQINQHGVHLWQSTVLYDQSMRGNSEQKTVVNNQPKGMERHGQGAMATKQRNERGIAFTIK